MCFISEVTPVYIQYTSGSRALSLLLAIADVPTERARNCQMQQGTRTTTRTGHAESYVQMKKRRFSAERGFSAS